MAKRNIFTIIDEILSKKSRLPFAKNHRWDSVFFRLNRISETTHLLDMLESTMTQEGEKAQDLFDELVEVTNSSIDSSKILDLTYEISRYIPIGLVSCLEGYFRLVYADLLDFGSPYIENVDKLNIRHPFNNETIFTLEKSLISLGDFAAHTLQTSSLDNVDKIMSDLIGGNFLTQFKNEFLNYEKNKIQPSFFPMSDEDLENHGVQVISDVRRLFELRHMYAHEVDPKIYKEDFDTIWRGVDATFKFIWNTEQILKRLLAVR